MRERVRVGEEAEGEGEVDSTLSREPDTGRLPISRSAPGTSGVHRGGLFHSHPFPLHGVSPDPRGAFS